MTNIKIDHLTFGYDQLGSMLFDNAQLNIASVWKLGLVGRNGRGKTTLLKLLRGELPYQGQINHQLEMSYFPKKIYDPSELTYYALSETEELEIWKMERELTLLNCDLDILWRPFHTLSGGEQTKVLLALLFLDEHSFPLIDEPTNHLDMKGRQQVAEYLKKKKQGYIVVSHDRTFLDQTVDHILAIEKNQLILYQGNFSTYEEQKAQRDAFEQAQNSKLKKEIQRLQKTAQEKAEWSASREKDKTNKSKGFIDTEYRRVSPGAIGADAARMMKRSKAIVQRVEGQISEKEKLLKNIESADALRINYEESYHRRILQVEELGLFYSDKCLFKDKNFELLRGECLTIIGKNGSGKTSLLQALLGEFSGKVEGSIQRASGLKISCVRQNYENNQGTLEDFAEKEGLEYSHFLNNLRKLGMERRVFANRIQDMSMGQRKKVELAKSLSQRANLYIWDEPLNYLDVFNQKQILELLHQFKPTMILIEHDDYFVKMVSDKIVRL
ncbi:lincosamide and streptogramin A transport system ATP-binding/permease protein [Enterococcus malodoratus]|uniref:ribosomal protection-like ABC-F family protein n=1 Tax=Enterococcus malodoratus TaxID=71451 RepID=UPI0008D370C4|nr:ABC-F type ribosomal protection protein [Enterococcus malodoratus]SET39147.1 lincosamide and streptogramin A transport system ATP-binding/permease protein [Enterococcus malodoratus]